VGQLWYVGVSPDAPADPPSADGHPTCPPVDQLLGVNDQDIAVGFYVDANGNTDGLLATPGR
jgi:hypothetical protein